MTKVLLSSCETGPDAWRHEEDILRGAFPKNDPDLVLTEDPGAADIIIIGNVRTENNYLKLRTNPLVRQFPSKCFTINCGDFPARFVKGILSNLNHSIWNLGRFESGGFFTFHPDFQNPYIEEFTHSTQPVTPTKEYLCSFVGRDCTPLRNQLFKLKFSRPDTYIKDNSHFNNFSHSNVGKTDERFQYFDAMVKSKFALCPRGWGPGTSQRMFDAMRVGTAPVVLSDQWVLPKGPDWHSFTIFIGENDVSSLEKTLLANEHRHAEMGQLAREAFNKYFHGEAYVRYLIDCCHRINQASLLPESLIQRFWPAAILAGKCKTHSARLLSKLRSKG